MKPICGSRTLRFEGKEVVCMICGAKIEDCYDREKFMGRLEFIKWHRSILSNTRQYKRVCVANKGTE